MDPTPPTPGSRIQYLGDRLIVTFRPMRSWGAIVFSTLWLAFWTFGGIAAVGAFIAGGWAARVFLFVWLCGWAAGEAVVAVLIAWELKGRELLIVTPEQLEVRKQVGRFARTNVYDTPRVQTVEAARTPSDDEDQPRKDFCLKVISGDKSFAVGEGMTEREAEDVAAAVRELIRPRTWWGEEEKEPWNFPRLYQQSAAKQSRNLRLRQAIFPVIVVAALAWLAVHTLSGPEEPQTPRLPPVRGANEPVRVYASAQTAYALQSSGVTPLGMPSCNARTSTDWICTVRARSTTPPFAGRTMVYRCEAIDGGTRCGPARQPPLGG